MRLIALTALCLSMPAWAGPIDLSWSARVTDSAGEPLEGTQGLHLFLCETELGSCDLWDETFSLEASQGYVSTTLSVTTAILGHPEVWIKIEHNGAELLPRQKLSSVPYAAIAESIRLEGAPAQETCVGEDGRIVFDTDVGALRVCDGAEWVRIGGVENTTFEDAFRYSNGSSATSCAAYLDPPIGYPVIDADGLYWLDPDGSGGEAAFKGWCDQTLDGGGWLLVGWANGNGNFASGRDWSEYAGGAPAITPELQGFSSYINTMGTQFDGASLDARLTYFRADQTTLDLSTSTTRAYSVGSTWTGPPITSNPLPNSARHTVNHNCSGYQYVDQAGNESSLDNGCFIEFTNGNVGGWAACGQNAYTSGNASWNLCFDDGRATSPLGNSVLGIWYAGAPSYHEVYEDNFNGTTPANTPESWGSFGGHWTWSAWVRPS